MTNIECELCEIDGEIELYDRTFIKLTPEMLPTLAEQSKSQTEQKLVYEKLVLTKYLNSKGYPCYSRITEDEAPESEEARIDLMELEAE